MPVKVSVVVPVYNPGEHIQPLIDSLLRQSMPAGEYEAVFVDDGSTDGTPALLDRLAAEHPHLRVVHQPNSGWPGRPRNVGIEQARGDYVFFSDNDDWFGDEALERMHACAVRSGADIVIGKMVGHGREVPRELFRRNRDAATFEDTPLQDSLTPHKLFRRAFLAEHGLRFPEGKRRLEDHVFVMKAYFAADVVSVLADYDCYHHVGRPDDSNAALVRIEPVSYYGYVRETVDVVVANTEPGVVQDRLLRRFLRVEIIARFEGRRFTALSRSQQRRLFDAARSLVVETMPTSVDGGLPGRQRLLAGLLRAGDLRSVRRLAFWSLPNRCRLTDVSWDGAKLRVRWSARLGRPGLLRREGERVHLVAPGHGRGPHLLDVARDLARVTVELIAVDPRRGEVIVPGEVHVEVLPDGRLSAVGESTIGFGSGARALSAGLWALTFRARALGWVSDNSSLRWPGRRQPSAALVGKGTLVRATLDAHGAPSLDVGGTASWLDAGFALRTAWWVQPDGQVTVRLPASSRGVSSLPVRIGARRYDAVVTAGADGTSDITVGPDLPAGPVSADIAGRAEPLPLGIVLSRDDDSVVAKRPVSTTSRLQTRRLRTTLKVAASPLTGVGERAARRLIRRRP